MFNNEEIKLIDLNYQFLDHFVRLDKNLNNMLFSEFGDSKYNHMLYEMSSELFEELI